MNKKIKLTIIIIISVIVIAAIWGVIGANTANSIGVTCDIGIGDSVCWKWHTNTVGQVGEFFKNLAN